MRVRRVHCVFCVLADGLFQADPDPRVGRFFAGYTAQRVFGVFEFNKFNKLPKL